MEDVVDDVVSIEQMVDHERDDMAEANVKPGEKEDATPAPQAAPETTEGTSSSLLESSSSPSTASPSKPATFVYDPNKITLRFLFAGRDGIHVLIDCKPNDTVGEVKGALMSVWPEDMPECTGGDRIRLICMGKGILMPDSKTLQAAEVPVFPTHPTPINVSVRPEEKELYKPSGLSVRTVAIGDVSSSSVRTNRPSGCGCVIS